MIVVSRGSRVYAGGEKMCSRCGRRKPRKGQRWCNPCFADNARERRAGKIERLVTYQEWTEILAARAAAAAAAPGRHRAAC